MKTLYLFFLLILSACSTEQLQGDPNNSTSQPEQESREEPAITEEKEFQSLYGGNESAENKIKFEPFFKSLPIYIYFEDENYIPDEEWEKAFRFWSNFTGNDLFDFSSDTNANVTVSWDDSEPYVWRSSRAAPSQGNGRIEMPPPQFDDINSDHWVVIAHELGHVLGFGHSDKNNCIMSLTFETPYDTGCDLSVLKDYVNSLPKPTDG